MTSMEDNVDLMAKHYVEVINGTPDGLGQYRSYEYGVSHNVIIRMTALYGEETTKRALDKALREYRK